MTSNFVFDDIKAALLKKVAESKSESNKNIMSIHLISNSKEKTDETAAERKVRVGVPSYSIENLMK